MEINLRNPSSAWAAAAVVLFVAVSILIFRIISLRKSLKKNPKPPKRRENNGCRYHSND